MHIYIYTFRDLLLLLLYCLNNNLCVRTWLYYIVNYCRRVGTIVLYVQIKIKILDNTHNDTYCNTDCLLNYIRAFQISTSFIILYYYVFMCRYYADSAG